MEFADFREYTAGDDLRYVDWNTAARFGRHYLKLYTEEQDLLLLCVVDCSAGMDFGRPTKLRAASAICAAAGVVTLSRFDRMQLQTVPGFAKPHAARVQRGRAAVPRLLSTLNGLEPGGRADTANSMAVAAAQLRGVGIALLAGDLLEEDWQLGVRALLSRGFEVCVAHVLSREEMDPEISGDVRLIDSETGEAREMSVTPALMARYRERLQAFLADAGGFCRRFGVGYHLTVSDTLSEQEVLRVLRGMGLV